MAKSGYTLPVFATAAAKAALQHLSDTDSPGIRVELNLLPGLVHISVEQVARLDSATALGVTRSDPGENLDLTRDTPVWAQVRLVPRGDRALVLEAGEGVGLTAAGEPAIYDYARRLFAANLTASIPSDRTAIVRIVLPQGRMLAQRTSNAAFGILEGLSLLGTSGIAEPHTATDKREEFRAVLQTKAEARKDLAFCIGHNGLRSAAAWSIPDCNTVQVGNWLGALLVEAAMLEVRSVLLVGYHGKLIKLAGGIFNTSSHIADAKLEILAAIAVRTCDNLEIVRGILAADTAEAAAKLLQDRGIAAEVFAAVAQQISERTRTYVHKYAGVEIRVGTLLSDRQGEVVGDDRAGRELLSDLQQLEK